MESMTTSYPRLAARTLRFTLGVPRNVSVTDDGARVYFIRTPDGVTRTGELWEFDVRSGTEALVVDPIAVLRGGEELSEAERARRERSREAASGLVAYALDGKATRACFALSGRLFLVDLDTKQTRELPAVGPIIDPRLDPTGTHVAYANAHGEFRVVDTQGFADRLIAGHDSETETWGQAEFIAAEEMERHRGYWWSPDGRSLLLQQTEEAPVDVWYVADPAHPERKPRTQRYPAAGTPNAEVRLWHVDLATAERTEIQWDRDAFEYLARVSWTENFEPLLQVLSRDQRHSLVLDIDVATGTTTTMRELRDDAWVELGPAPRRDSSGRLVTCEDVDDHRRVLVDGRAISGDDWQVRGIVGVFDDSVVATASQEPTEIHVVRFGHDGSTEMLTAGSGVFHAVMGGPTSVIMASHLDRTAPQIHVHSEGREPSLIQVRAEPAPFQPQVQLLRLGDRALSAAVLFPRDHVPGSKQLPVLMDPYGGPHAQRVLASGRMFLESQWLADQGFCVVVADGRGTPGRGHTWERAVRHEFASVTLQDQVDAVEALGKAFPDEVDLARVGITGWSYGGYLAALAVLDRPDVFAAAVAGAPVTEWRLYDTCYTERYLGDPREQAEVYDRNSLLTRASGLQRPLMLIHGLADDNVVAAHTLRLSAALLEAGSPHTVLPLSGVTHMTPQEDVAANLKLLQLDFLLRALS